MDPLLISIIDNLYTNHTLGKEEIDSISSTGLCYLHDPNYANDCYEKMKELGRDKSIDNLKLALKYLSEQKVGSDPAHEKIVREFVSKLMLEKYHFLLGAKSHVAKDEVMEDRVDNVDNVDDNIDDNIDKEMERVIMEKVEDL